MNHPPEMSVKAQAIMYLAIGAIMLCICIPVLLPWVPISIALVLAVVVGIPLLILSNRYTQEEQRSQGYTPTQSFWPKRQEIAVALAGVTATTLMAVPFAILLTMIWLMPAGDDWPLVIARLACLGTWFALSFAWWRKIRATFRDRFRHVFPQESLEKVHAYWNADKSPTRIQSICGCLTWLTIGILAVLIAVNVIDLNGFQMGNAPRKLRGLAVIINWCQGNPNFTRSSMVIASIISVALSAQYARAAITSKQLWRTTP